MSRTKRNGDISTGYRILVLLGVLLLICSLAACGSGSSVVGEWYNKEGKCLDIQSNGSWKLEGSYGTGTWKKLNDGIFEFTDFYGDTQESAINKDELGQYIDFGYYGKFYKHIQDDDSETNTETTDVVLNEINEFNNGVAWVTYTNTDEQEMICLIDTTGKKLYEDVYNGKTHKAFNGEVSWFYGDNNEIILINNMGEIVTNSERSNFDKVVGYGDGIFLVYKNQSSISEIKHLYRVINKNGKILSCFDLGCKPDDEARYAGCGIFVLVGKPYEKILFNYKTQNVVYIDTKTAANYINFVDDMACFDYDDRISYTGESYSKPGNYFALNTNFETKEIEYFNYVTDGIAIQCNGYMMPTVEYVSITEIATNDKTEIKDYPANRVESIQFNGEYGTIQIIGADGKSYFSLIDRKGNFQFEPIRGNYAVFSDEYVTFKNQDNTYGICDKTGMILANNLAERHISEFDNGIAVTFDDRYIDATGKEIIMNLK